MSILYNIILIISVLFNIKTSVAQDIESNSSNQYLENVFLNQPKYNKNSIQFFLTDVYNHKHYAQKFLALNFSHVKTFLSYSSESKQSRTYIKSVLKLFGQKIKSSSFVNAYAFGTFLNDLPFLLKTHFSYQDTESNKKKQIKESLYNFLLNDFNDLKKDPEKTLNNITQQIYNIAFDKKSDSDTPILELQMIVNQFLEIAIGKLVWSPEDQKEVWDSVKNISNSLEALNQENIIDIETLDELCWTLISRFCYFLDVCGNELKEECFEQMNQDLSTKSCTLWTLSEREELITTKSYHLKRAIVESEIRSRAWHSGLITDMLPPIV